MQEYKKIIIGKDEIIPVAERMRKEGRSYDYAVDPAVESYHVIGEMKVPSISEIYDTAASWPERELNELMGIEFEGLDVSKRLFLPEDMLETQGKGQILVMPLKELVDKNLKEEQ